MQPIRLGIMGFGRVGRQLYQLAVQDERFDVVAVSDIGSAGILHNLLTKTDHDLDVKLENNYLVSERGRTRLMSVDRPTETPWDVFDVDVVIEATGRFRTLADLVPHLDNGAPRVVLSELPEEKIDRVLLYGVNEASAKVGDQIISAGSASTTATALVLKIITGVFAIEQATMTSVHAYTSDQSLQDYAGPDYRRSRSGAENIIPNATPALHWVQEVLPEVAGKLSAYALNVPVQVGSMLDLTIAFSEPDIDIDTVNQLFISAAKERPALLKTIGDPIVSSDVKGIPQSLLVDLLGTMKAGDRMIKMLAWHETLGHSRRILDVVDVYAGLDSDQKKEVS
ncbi:MAG: glyceraldehyde 3-phosphate dehydrogenase NAD-binding domain-containing protein [Candidatus Azotimanducaceae bacterium]|uniref:Glyceraldehyde-3-phosphate dehydrogenase n=1 Tax=OM182 bacterium TaxID=2510334 RepID=A0A520RYT3_9GAMM|nr:glyceraldehyde-3-phosphate dehydrogenase [Gammaproteobacteria bacterium]RZO75368.1 MAG: glyceraldehyde-3-phosphate dehydrogenase [OM182 bacterium]